MEAYVMTENNSTDTSNLSIGDDSNKKQNDDHLPEDILPEKHPINKSLTNFLHRIRDNEDCFKTYIPLSLEKQANELTDLNEELEKVKKIIEKGELENDIETVKVFLNARRKGERLQNSKPYEVLLTSLFIGLFSTYDSFTGDILTSIFIKKPELYSSLSKTLTITDILQHNSFDSLKEGILRNEVEDFRRKSYIEQFDHLENLFGIKLKEFDTWPDFVECSQRRNLLTHCDGIVSKQYLDVCKKVGFICKDPLSVGDRLSLDRKYFLRSCDILAEVGFKLAQTLWRKLFPEELSDADTLLTEITYEWLLLEKWGRAKVCADFGINQKRLSNDLSKKIAIINYAIACKYRRDSNEVEKILSSIDWSASLEDFQLAVAVLKENFDLAVKLMHKIGKSGELVKEQSYHVWPLFRSFRENAIFLKTYEEIYGHTFIKELHKEAEAAQTETSQKIIETGNSIRQEFAANNNDDES